MVFRRQSTTTNLLEVLDQWLATQHTVLWGRMFDVQDAKTRARAAEWLLDVLIDLRQDEVIPVNFFRRQNGR